jgi:glycosyltransferase involved in cell wall biosynthesis
VNYYKDKVSIIIPAKNEGEGLKRIIDSVKKYSNDIIIVDGHSQDNTKSIALKQGVRYLLDHGLGRGDGVKIGLKAARGDIIIMFDADGSHDVQDIPRLIDLLLDDQLDMVICSRRRGGSSDMEMNLDGLIRSVGSDLLVMLVNHKFNTHLTDILYSFRAFKKSAIKKIQLESDDFCIEQEMLVKALKNNLRILEIPSNEKARGWGKSKLKTSTGIEMALKLIKQVYF